MALTDDLIEYWKLDGNSKGIFGNNGADTSVTYNASNGKLIQGVGFQPGYIEIPHNAVFNVTTALSISLWMKSNTLQVNKYFISKPANPAGGNNGWDISTGSAINKVKFILLGLTPQNAEVTANIYDGNWHHIVLTYGGNNLTCYIDNNVVVNNNTTGSISTNNNALTIGSFYRTNYNALFAGAIDEVGIWKRKLSAGEVSDLYLQGNGSQYPFRDKIFLSI